MGQMAAGMMSAGQPPARQMLMPAACRPATEKPPQLLALEDGPVEDIGASAPVPEPPQAGAAASVPDAGAKGVPATLAALKGAVENSL